MVGTLRGPLRQVGEVGTQRQSIINPFDPATPTPGCSTTPSAAAAAGRGARAGRHGRRRRLRGQRPRGLPAQRPLRSRGRQSGARPGGGRKERHPRHRRGGRCRGKGVSAVIPNLPAATPCAHAARRDRPARPLAAGRAGSDAPSAAGVRLWLLGQDLAQLRAAYRAMSDSLLANAAVLQGWRPSRTPNRCAQGYLQALGFRVMRAAPTLQCDARGYPRSLRIRGPPLGYTRACIPSPLTQSIPPLSHTVPFEACRLLPK